MKKFYTFTLLFCFPFFLAAQVYVNVDAAGGTNDGSSWANAYTDLESALSLSSPSEIWIAQGVYKPSLQDTFVYFSFEAAHEVYGGFDGTETQLDQRDPVANVTTIEGDINGDDISNNFEMNKGDNANHLFYLPAGLSATVIDGLNFQGGSTYYTSDLDDFSWRGGAIYALSPIDLSNCNFTANGARSGACIYVVGTVGTSITDCNMSNNYATSQAAGIMLNSSVSATISNIEVTNNLTNRGCVYTLFSNNVTISDVNFLNNLPHPDSWGASGFQNWNSTNVTLNNCTFQGNIGGNASSLYMDGREGNEMNTTLNGCTFDGNITTSFGGTFYAWRANYEMNDCIFNNNNGPNAAAIYNANTVAQINNTSFTLNTATFGGATANYNEETNVTYEGCTFFNNTADFSGGASMVGFKGHVDFVDCTFESNMAETGGAIRVQNDSTSASFTSCHFLANETENYGGALASFQSSPISFYDCNFELNKSDVGGAVSIIDDTLYLSNIQIEKCKFNFNTAYTQGGALNFGNTDVSIMSSLFTFNVAEDIGTGACISNNSSDTLNSNVVIVNSTFSENVGALASGIAQYEDGTADATLTLQNNILYNTLGDDYAVEEGEPEIISMGGNLVFQADLIDDFSNTNDDVGSDPVFVDATSFDFTLQSSSPAINSGIATGAQTSDVNGDPIVGDVDKGCYEFQGIIESTANLIFYSQMTLLNNPAVDFSVLQIENEYVGDLTVQIVDATGKQFSKIAFQKTLEVEQFVLHVSDLAKGTYFVQVIAADKMASKRLIKM